MYNKWDLMFTNTQEVSFDIKANASFPKTFAENCYYNLIYMNS